MRMAPVFSRILFDRLVVGIELFAEKTALICGNRSLNYSEFGAMITSAQKWIRRHLEQTDYICLHATPSIESTAIIYACFFEKKTIVPFQPSDSHDHILKIAASLPSFHILYDTRCSKNLRSAVNPNMTLVTTLFLAPAASCRPSYSQKHANNSTMLILHTSGSTGKPRGVQIDEKNLRAFFNGIHAVIGFKERDVFLNTHLLHFDMAYFSMLQFCLCSGTLVLPESEPARIFFLELIPKHQVTTLFVVPPHIAKLKESNLSTKLDVSSLTKVLFAGDRLHSTEALFFIDQNPHVQIFNLYGPTETTIAFTCYAAKSRFDLVDPIPIGHPFQNTTISIITGERAGPSQEGELVAHGDQVSQLGYFQLESSLFSSEDEIRSYKTGDRVRVADDGNLYFLGRIDRQVKRSGVRIDLGEIESLVLAQGLFKTARCLFKEKKILLFTSDPLNRHDADLKQLTNQRLPRHLIIDELVVVPELYLTKNGKWDDSSLEKFYERSPRRHK